MTRSHDAPVTSLDAEYDLRSAFPDYEQYFADWAARSRSARQHLRCLLDVPYGPGPRDRVDFFRANTPSAPLLVYIHGGYWRSLDKSDFSFLAVPFVKCGTSLALINYELFPGTTMSHLVAQVRRACAWIALNAGRFDIDYTEFHLAGWSAGAHLAAIVLCSDMERRLAVTQIGARHTLQLRLIPQQIDRNSIARFGATDAVCSCGS